MAELVGADALLDALRRVERDLENDRIASRSAGSEVLDDALRRVPRDTEQLARSGRIEAGSGQALVRFGGPLIRHVHPVHSGSFNRPQGGFVRPVPFLDDANTAQTDDVVDIYEQQLARLLALAGLT